MSGFLGFCKRLSRGNISHFDWGISLFLSQTLDTALFSFLGLYGLVASVIDIMIVSLLAKWVAIGCSASLIALARRLIKPKVLA